MSNSKSFSAKIKKFFKVLGFGLITGASDDDPSGIREVYHLVDNAL